MARLANSGPFSSRPVVRRALAWAQASSSGTHLSALLFNELVKQFETIFDRPNHPGCASDQLFTLHRGTHSMVDYAMEFRILSAPLQAGAGSHGEVACPLGVGFVFVKKKDGTLQPCNDY